MPGELLRRRDGRVATQPGQRHLVAVHGFQLGPHSGRQRSGQGSGASVRSARKQQPGEDDSRRRRRGARARAGQLGRGGVGHGGGRCPGGRGEGGRLEQLGGPDGGQQPGHAAVGHGSVGEPLRGAGRQFGRQRGSGRGQGSGGRSSAGRRRRTGQRLTALPAPEGKPVPSWPGTRRALAWLVSKLTVRATAGCPSPGGGPRQVPHRRPAAAWCQPARRTSPVRKTAVRRALWGSRD